METTVDTLDNHCNLPFPEPYLYDAADRTGECSAAGEGVRTYLYLTCVFSCDSQFYQFYHGLHPLSVIALVSLEEFISHFISCLFFISLI